jgi:hypothetical protein
LPKAFSASRSWYQASACGNWLSPLFSDTTQISLSANAMRWRSWSRPWMAAWNQASCRSSWLFGCGRPRM